MKLRFAASGCFSLTILAALGMSPILSACGDQDPQSSGSGADTSAPNPGPNGDTAGPGGGASGGDAGGGNPDNPDNPDEPGEDEGGDPCLRNKGGLVWETQIRELNDKGIEAATAATAFDSKRGRLYLGLSGLFDKDGAKSVSSHSVVAFTTRGKRVEWEARRSGEFVGPTEFITGIGINPDGSVMSSVREMRGTNKGPNDETFPVFQGWAGHVSEGGDIVSEDVFEQTEANPDSVGPRPSVSAGFPDGGLVEGGSSDFDSEEFPGNALKAYFRIFDSELKLQQTFYYAAPKVDPSAGGLTDVRVLHGLDDGGFLAIIEGSRSLTVVYTHLVRFDAEGKEVWTLDFGSLTEYDPGALTVTDKGEIWVAGAHNHYKGKAPEDRVKQLEVPFWRKYWVSKISEDGKILETFEGSVPGSSMAKPDDATTATGIAIDRVGNIWLSGTDSVSVEDAPDPYKCQHLAWAKKLSPEGKELWHTEMKSKEYKYFSDYGVSINVDKNCNGFFVANYTRYSENGQKCKLVPAVVQLKP